MVFSFFILVDRSGWLSLWVQLEELDAEGFRKSPEFPVSVCASFTRVLVVRVTDVSVVGRTDQPGSIIVHVN